MSQNNQVEKQPLLAPSSSVDVYIKTHSYLINVIMLLSIIYLLSIIERSK